MWLFTLLILPIVSANYELEVRVKFVKIDKLYRESCPNEDCGCSVALTFTYVRDQLGTLGPHVQHGMCYRMLSPYDEEIWQPAKYNLPSGLLQRLCVNFTPVITGIKRTFVLQQSRYQTAALHDVNVQPYEEITSCQHLVFDGTFHDMIVPDLNISDTFVRVQEDFLTIEYMLQCGQFYYGDECEKRCKDFEFGHYTCDKLGHRQCQFGYQGLNCTCRDVNGTLQCGDYETTTVGPEPTDDPSMDQLILVLSVCLALVISVCACIGVCIYLVRKRNRRPPRALAKAHPAIIVSDLSDGDDGDDEEPEDKEEELENAGVYIGEQTPIKPEIHRINEESQPQSKTSPESSPGGNVQTSTKPVISAPIPQTEQGTKTSLGFDGKPRTSLTLVDEMEKAASDLDPITEGEEDEPSPQKDIYQSQPCLTTNGKLTLQPWLSQPQLPNGLKQSLSQELAKRRFKVQTFII